MTKNTNKRDDVERIRSWFCVLNNPSDIEQYKTLTPEEICQNIIDKWVNIKPEKRSAACTYCISSGGLHHLHIVLEDSDKVSFDHIKGMYPTAHIEATRGNKKQAKKYILKEAQYAEKGEEIICIKQHGEIESNQGMRTDIDRIGLLIQEGKTPREILKENFEYRKFEKMIKQAFYDKRFEETPLLREVNVIFHVGDSGTGKTYSYIDLCNRYGSDQVYLMSDYDNGGLDLYNGERILFMDEFRGQIRYSTLLAMLQGYRQQFHSRYSNIYGLWDEVHISSVLPPELMYKNMVTTNQDTDTIRQLLRRITTIIYHYKNNNDYKSFELSGSEYVDYIDLKNRALYPHLYNEEYYKNKSESTSIKSNLTFSKPLLPNPFKN